MMDTDAEITSEAILAVATSFMAAKHLFVASEIGLFSALGDGPLSLDELAQRTGIPRASVRILADAMVALGFVAWEDDRYRNVSVAQAFHDPIPVGHDVVLVANVIHVFSPDHNRELLSCQSRCSARDGTPPRRLLDRCVPYPAVFAALMAGEWLTASGEADCYSVEDVTEWLRHTGWTVDRHQTVAGPSSLVVAHVRMG